MTRFPFRVVADPNVLVAAAITKDPASPVRVIVDAAALGRVELITCPMLWAELESVLGRPKIASRMAAGGARAFLHALHLIATDTADPNNIPTVVTDPNDDYLIALATAQSVHYLVSGDRAVLAAQVEGLNIVTPREFAERLTS